MVKMLFKPPAYDGPTSRRIRKIRQPNPKRKNSYARVRFSQYKTGMTVQEYIDACAQLDVPNYAIFDITWDTDPRRKFIELYD